MNSPTGIDTFIEDELLSILDEILGDHRNHYATKKQISYDCPICSAEKGIEHDGKGNFEINYKKGVYKCWACGETHGTKGSVRRLVNKFGSRDQYRRFKDLDITFDYNATLGDVQYTKVDLPEEAVLLSTDEGKRIGKLGYEYLQKRGITDDMIEKYSLFYVHGGKYKNRILIPSYNEYDELEYFVTRSIFKNKLKYLNPVANKQAIIFNESMIDWFEPVTIVEGPFDHLVIPNSIPLLGKKFYEVVYSRIYNNAKSRIYIALDGDAYNDAKELYRTLDTGRLKGRVYIIPVPKTTDVSEIFQKEGIDGLKKIFKQAKRLVD